MVQVVVKIPESQHGQPNEWAMIELQGTLETRHPVPLGGRFIGDLHFTHKDVPVLIIGHHILYGKVMTLEKPYGIMVKDTSQEETGGPPNYHITAVIKKKLLFKTRPKPIIANVPKKI
ncbi:chromosome transmission fidelity protein 8 homolog [Mercenaria mercenaria]|uniref:chromosome transmission fidelity protein 8 homolog n=1 Tax=Mercenaria mercenaria TaxID=6596 RepID=UPI001E1D75AB|nr:chromosome transmission fidelity protein 8 homolog [Mercenaria mercenaria]